MDVANWWKRGLYCAFPPMGCPTSPPGCGMVAAGAEALWRKSIKQRFPGIAAPRRVCRTLYGISWLSLYLPDLLDVLSMPHAVMVCQLVRPVAYHILPRFFGVSNLGVSKCGGFKSTNAGWYRRRCSAYVVENFPGARSLRQYPRGRCIKSETMMRNCHRSSNSDTYSPPVETEFPKPP